MLTAEQLWDIRRRLARGESGRRVAKTLRISRGTVATVAHGLHCSGRARESEVAAQEGHQGPAVAVRRCAKAGHLFHGAVCLTCLIRALPARRRFARGVGSPVVRIELVGGARRRWLTLQATARDRLTADAPRVLVHNSRLFRFELGFHGLAFRAKIHPPVHVEPAQERSLPPEKESA